MMNTAMMARNLGVSTATVFRYVDRGLLHALVRDPAILVDGDEFARFKREDWPLLPIRAGRMGRPKEQESITLKLRIRDLRRLMRGIK